MISSTLPSVCLLLACFTSTGCSSDTDCSKQRSGDFAILLRFEEEDCGSVRGTVEETESEVVSDLECAVTKGGCHCKAGSSFGTYRVSVTDPISGELQEALMSASAASAPICVNRKALTRFEPLGVGGVGGASD